MDKETLLVRLKKWFSPYAWYLFLWLSCQTQKEAVKFFHRCYMSHKDEIEEELTDPEKE